MSLDPFPDGLPLDADAVGQQFAGFLAQTMGGAFEQMMELGKRLGDDEGEEFAAGLRSVIHEAIDRVIRPDATDEDVMETMQAQARFIESWLVSSRLDGSEEWHRQMESSNDALQRNDVGQPLTASEL